MDISVKVTTPKEVLNVHAFLKANEDGLNWLVRETHKDFAATTGKWIHQPKFEEERAHDEGDTMVARCGTDDDRYAMINNGLPEHPIVPGPGKKKVMSFQPGYTAKTMPGYVGSRASSRSGAVVHRTKILKHKITARHFDDTIQEKRAPDLERIGVRAVEAGMK